MSLNTYEFKFEDIYDPSEQEKYIFEALQLDCFAFVFLYDTSDKEIFSNLTQYIKELKFDKYPELNVLFVGNKIDLKDIKITKEEVQKKVFKIFPDTKIQSRISFHEISLKEKTGCDALFNQIRTNLYEKAMSIGYANVLEAKTINISKQANYPEIRISLFGNASAGKTSLAKRFVAGTFSDVMAATIGQSFSVKFIKINDAPVKYYVWDTAGQERYRDALPKALFQNADGILLLLDLTDEKVEEIVNTWIKNITEKISIVSSNNNNGKVILYLVGNKIDIVKDIFFEDKTLKRVVSRETVEKIASTYGVKYFETSCKENINISEVAYRLAYECYERLPEERKNPTVKKVKQNTGCCGGGGEKKKNKI